VEAIKEAIAELAAPEKTTLISWLNSQDSDDWDRQIEADFSNGGVGMSLLDQWDTEIKAGTSISLEELLTQRETQSHTKYPGE
jgi:hypothetical protein